VLRLERNSKPQSMARAEKKLSKGPAVTLEPSLASASFHFLRFMVNHSEMQELEIVPRTAPPPQQSGQSATEIGVAARVTITGERGLLSLDVVVTTDPALMPYRIQVTATAEFGMKNGTKDQFAVFLKNNGPALMFPYVRQTIDQLTADGRFGRVRLDPINMQALLNRDAWSEEPPLNANEQR
jgi:preprotein translocase subunit SecB